MWKKLAKYMVSSFSIILILCVTQYSCWMYQIGFMSSTNVKHEIIKLKINSHLEPYWFEDVVISSKSASYFYSEDEKIDYFVGICYLLQRERYRSAKATISIFNNVNASDMKLMIEKINELKNTKYQQILTERMMYRCKVTMERHPNYINR